MEIRKMQASDTRQVLEMMRVFYASPAVRSNGSEEIFQNDIQNCLKEDSCLDGYVFAEDHEIMGYAMTARSYSTEFGRPCIWIEDVYVKKEYQGKGIGKAFFAFLDGEHSGAILRLEVETENENAMGLYRKCGFDEMGYVEMKKILE